MGRIYTILVEAGAVTTAQDLLYIKSSSAAIIIIHDLLVHQEDVTADDNMVIQLHRVTGDATGGTTLTNTQQAAGVVNKNLTGDTTHVAIVVAEHSGGTTPAQVVWREPGSVLAGIQKIWTPETRPILAPSERMVVSSDIAITVATLNIQMTIEEIG